MFLLRYWNHDNLRHLRGRSDALFLQGILILIQSSPRKKAAKNFEVGPTAALTAGEEPRGPGLSSLTFVVPQ